MESRRGPRTGSCPEDRATSRHAKRGLPRGHPLVRGRTYHRTTPRHSRPCRAHRRRPRNAGRCPPAWSRPDRLRPSCRCPRASRRPRDTPSPAARARRLPTRVPSATGSPPSGKRRPPPTTTRRPPVASGRSISNSASTRVHDVVRLAPLPAGFVPQRPVVVAACRHEAGELAVGHREAGQQKRTVRTSRVPESGRSVRRIPSVTSASPTRYVPAGTSTQAAGSLKSSTTRGSPTRPSIRASSTRAFSSTSCSMAARPSWRNWSSSAFLQLQVAAQQDLDAVDRRQGQAERTFQASQVDRLSACVSSSCTPARQPGSATRRANRNFSVGRQLACSARWRNTFSSFSSPSFSRASCSAARNSWNDRWKNPARPLAFSDNRPLWASRSSRAWTWSRNPDSVSGLAPM